MAYYQIGSPWVRSTTAVGGLSTNVHGQIQVVAGDDSTANGLHLYARVAVWKGLNGTPECAWFFGPTSVSNILIADYRLPSGTGSFIAAYDASINDGIITHTGGQQGSGSRVINNGSLAEWYYDLGTFGPGETATTNSYKVQWSGGSASSGVSTSYTVGSVTVTYNGNEGNGSVASQTRVIGWEGSGFGITLANNAFSRTNYEFVEWNTKADGTGTPYNEGDFYTEDTNLVLYAIWNRLTSTIEYNANKPADAAGTVSIPETQTKNPGVTIELSSMVPDGSVLQPPYNFVSWNTAANGTGTPYEPGATYTKDVNVTLYAQWKSDYTKSLYNAAPSIQRVDSHGDADVTGEYLKVSGVVRIYPVRGQWTTTPSSLAATWSRISDHVVAGTHTLSSSDFTDVTPSDITEYKLYSFSWTSSSAVLSSGEAYGVTIDFIDSYMAQYSIAAIRYTTTIAVAYVTFSTNGRGKSAAFGKQALPASALSGDDATSGRLDLYMNTYFHGTTNIPTYNPVDEIVETGTDGNWTYRKWSSGIAECWGSYTWSITWSTWGNANYGFRTSTTGYMTYPEGLFNAIPKEFVTGSVSGGDGILAYNAYSNITSARTNNYYFIRPVTGWDPAGPAHINVYAIGTWK